MMKHVVITGGASGIGEAVALRLIRSGHRVTVLDRSEPETCSWWTDLDASLRGEWKVVDVADADAVTAAIDDVLFPVDGLVTCAGIATRENVLDTSLEQFEKTMAINLRGTFCAAQAVARQLVDQGRPGSIVTVASTAGIGYVAGLGLAYHASKSAVVGLTKSMAGDLARYGIRVNSVAPGVVRTPMTIGQRDAQGEKQLAARAPAGRLAEADEIASVIVWLLSPASRLTTGHTIPVEGGQVAITGAPGSGFEPPAVDTRAIPFLMNLNEKTSQ